jgi:hypothetical protein
MVKIEVKTTELLQALKFLKASFKLRRRTPLKIICEITVLSGKIELAVPGSFYELKCSTSGVAKATIPFIYLWDYTQSLKIQSYILIELDDDRLFLDGLSLKINTSYIENDRILRTIKLPANYTDIDILKTTNGLYTIEELEFNGLIPKIITAQKNLKRELRKAQNAMAVFGIGNNEVSELIIDRIGIDINKSIKSH